MTEQLRADDASNDAEALVAAALHHAMRSGTRDAAPLRARVVHYVRGRKRLGLRPEEVVIELKAEIAKLLQRQPLAVAGPARGDVADVVAGQVIRLAIEAYFED